MSLEINRKLDDIFDSLRFDFRKQVHARLSDIDSYNPKAYEIAVKLMLEAHYTPKELSALLGTSQSSISRWVVGSAIPRSSSYRKWVIEALISYIQKDII